MTDQPTAPEPLPPDVADAPDDDAVEQTPEPPKSENAGDYEP